MPNLPDIVDMIDALIMSGITELELAQEADRLQKQKPIYQKNKKMMYKHLCDKYNIALNINFGTHGQDINEYTLVADLSMEQSQVNLRGYILYIPESWDNKKGTGTRTLIIFADETGIVPIGVNQIGDDLIDRLSSEVQKFPAAAFIAGVTTGSFNDRLSVGLPNWENCGWQLIGKTDYDLPPIEKIYEKLPNSETELENDQTYTFNGLIIHKEPGKAYTGCPECSAGLKVEVGTQTPCQVITADDGTTKGCGNIVEAVEYAGVSLMIGDAFGEISISFPHFSNITIDYINELCEGDPQPDVLISASQDEKYGLTGKWLVPLGNVTIDEGTGKQVVIASIDQLDFSKDGVRDKFVINENGVIDTSLLEPYITQYISPISHLNAITVNDFADYLKKQIKSEKEIEMKPIVNELLNRKMIKITDDKIAPTQVTIKKRETGK